MRKSRKKTIAFKKNCAALMTLVFFQILVQRVKRENCIYFFDVFSPDCNIKINQWYPCLNFHHQEPAHVRLHCNLHVSQYPRQVLMDKLFLGSSGSYGLCCVCPGHIQCLLLDLPAPSTTLTSTEGRGVSVGTRASRLL